MAGLSDRDMERIEEFVQTPWYKRNPDILVPDDEEEEHRRKEYSD